LAAQTVDRFGWPGALILISFFFVQYNGTPAQKQEIIDKFVLGKGVDRIYPFIVIVIIGLLTFFAQNIYWQRKVKALKVEIERLAKWKTDHQQKQIGGDLHHTDPGAPT